VPVTAYGFAITQRLSVTARAMSTTLHQQRQAWSVLIISTLAFTVCFTVWMLFGVIGIPIGQALGLSATQVGGLMAMPILAGSLVRMPLGRWTDSGDGRRLMLWLMALTLPGLLALPWASTYEHFLLAGFVIGLAGGSFAVGTPYVARWFPPHQQGMAMGIYGMGNVGAALNHLIAPVLLVAFGWERVPQVYATLMLLAGLSFWALSHPQPAARTRPRLDWRGQLRFLREPRVLRYCQYYSVVFGGFVALALWLVQHYVGEYGLNIRNAALLAVLVTLPGALLRGLGGVLADRFGAHSVTWWVLWLSWICLFLLSYPQTDFVVHTGRGPLFFHLGLNVHVFSALVMLLGIAWAFGRASVFKYISQDYPDHIGAVSGLVSMFGGLVGAALPVLFGLLLDASGVRSSAFMLLFGWVSLSLLWMYGAKMRRADVVQRP
jgi:MFS transporter, NNP family, nitrate/nitrite transporter